MRKTPETATTLSDDMLGQYFTEISKRPLLSREQEVELTQAFQDGIEAAEQLSIVSGEVDTEVADAEYAELGLIAMAGYKLGYKIFDEAIEKGSEARDTMISSNLRLVVSIAKRYQNRGLNLLDLIQEGNTGLMTAVERFDHRKGFKFSTYGTWWIRQAVTRAIANQGTTIRTPVHMNENLYRLRTAEREMESELGCVNDALLCAKLDVSMSKLFEWRTYKNQTTPLSLNETIGDDGDSEFGDMVADRDSELSYQRAGQKLDFEELWDNAVRNGILDDRDQEILALRFGLFGNDAHTLDQVGKKFDLTRERIRQIESRALRKLKDENRGFSVPDHVA